MEASGNTTRWADTARLELVQSMETAKGAIPRVIDLHRSTTIGRSSKLVHVVLDVTPNKSISRKHAEVVLRTDGEGHTTFVLRDLNSTNGVFVNDIKILEQTLVHHDIVQFGGAADILVGARFDGSGSHIRYRFAYDEAESPPAETHKRSQSIHTAPEAPAALRQKVRESRASHPNTDSWWQEEGQPSSSNGVNAPKLFRADTANAVSTLCAISRSGRGENTAATGAVVGSSRRGGSLDTARAEINLVGGDAQGTAQEEADVVGVVEREGASTAMLGILEMAACALCSEPLLNVCVLPCSHSFCRLCWVDHVEEEGTTCPECSRKFHSSERNPRDCPKLDMLISSLVSQQAGPVHRRRWEERKQKVHERATAATVATTAAAAAVAAVAAGMAAGEAGAAEAADKRASDEVPKASSSSREVPSSPAGVEAGRTLVRRAQAAGNGTHPRDGSAGGDSSRGASDRRDFALSKSGGRADKGGQEEEEEEEQVVALQCQGCNEVGHEFEGCPHRSDDAMEESEEEDDDELSEEDDSYDDGESSDDA